ncbi:Hypothetical predicted protein [Olea europaea subsp. europaea]|uniref:Uncharacterized protein n=1 Tax=Olea europaea subsp. europaea TaxID=158383 RepID=A0A8S0R9Q1_OLEEU|nr:Hypothetical predicted protein [Olea europaea subsp. europaea]
MIMNPDKKFQQIWEFRSREDDVDSSSDDSKSNSSHEPVHKKHKLVFDIVLPEKDEVNGTPRSQRNNKLHATQCVEGIKKRATLKRKKNIMQNKTRGRSVEEKKNADGNLRTEEMVMLDDFKNFTDSLIGELKVAREKMFGRMRDKMRKLMSTKSSLRPKKKDIECSRKNEYRTKRRSESRKKSKSNVASNTNEFPIVVEEGIIHNQVLEATPTKEPNRGKASGLPTKKAEDSDEIVSSSCLSLPLNDHILPAAALNKPSSEIEAGELLNGKIHVGFPGFQQEAQIGSFSNLSSKTTGFRGLHYSQTSSVNIGFPFPLHQGGLESQTLFKNSFMDNSIVSTRSNNGIGKFSGGSHAMPECSLVNSINSHGKYKADGEIVSVRTQDLKDGRFYMN